MNINDIRKHSPCYDPTKYLPEDWEGTALDILGVEECPPQDRLWVVTRPGWIDNKTLHLFAIWCARRALELVNDPDPRSIKACDVAEQYANGDTTSEELAAAWDAAGDAAWSTAGAADWSAAKVAARSAAKVAASAAASRVASKAAWDSARVAASAAASAAYWDWDAAWYTAWDKQVAKLIDILENT